MFPKRSLVGNARREQGRGNRRTIGLNSFEERLARCGVEMREFGVREREVVLGHFEVRDRDDVVD